MLVNETKAVELPLTQPRNALLNLVSLPFAAERRFGHANSPHEINPITGRMRVASESLPT